MELREYWLMNCKYLSHCYILGIRNILILPGLSWITPIKILRIIFNINLF